MLWRETHYTCRWCLQCAFSISAFDPQQGYNLKANTAMSPAQEPPPPRHTQFEYSTIVHTYVIVIVRVVVVFVDYKLVYSEGLFLVSICFIDGLFPQVYKQAICISEEKKKQKMLLMYSHLNITHQSYCCYRLRMAGKERLVSPIREAVCSADNPAWRDERASAEETSFCKDSSHPRVRLYGCE